MSRPALTLLAICLAFAASFVSSMQPVHADDAADRAARRHYERGQKLFNLQRFEEALDQYQKAFDAKPIPDFLFNIGQCHRNLGDYDAAIFSFKRFLKLDPDAPNREKVEELIAQLEEKKAAEDAKKLRLREDPARPPPPTEASTPIYKKWWFWTGVAVVGVAGGVTIYAATSGGPPDTTLGNIVFGK
jgi:tetratricopeptide (TPR) repeat protein